MLSDTIEAQLPGWRSIEVFGPPGAGKSHLCREASAALNVLTMCDRQAVRFYAARDLPRIAKMAEARLSIRLQRNFYGAWLRSQYWRYWLRPGPEVRLYLATVERVRDAFPLPRPARRRFDNRVKGSGAFIARAMNDSRQIIIDEGLLNQLNALIARSMGDQIDVTRRALVRECLARYPWEKTALFIDASPEVCANRQVMRGHVLFTPDRPQTAFHSVAELLDELCRETGWRTTHIRNN